MVHHTMQTKGKEGISGGTNMYDIIIIGAGPAGISAGIYAVSRGKKTLIIEKQEAGGLIGRVSTVTHYAGINEGETGASFARKLKAQAENAGVEMVYETVTFVKLQGEVKEIRTDKNCYRTAKVILANGTSPRTLGIEGEEKLRGKGMGMNAAKHGADYLGKHVYVVGGADGAVKEALYLSQYASQVTIIHFEETLGCIQEFKEKVKSSSNIDLRLHSRLHGVYGTDQVHSLDILDERTGSVETIADSGCGIFVYAGTIPNTELYTELHLKDGYIPVNEWMETEIPGVYAAGDIREKQVRQISTAVSDGTMAAIGAAR